MLSATPTREALASIAPLAMRSIRCSAPRAGSVANALAGRRAIATSPNLPHPTYPSCRIAGGSSLLSGHHSRHCLSSRPISSTSSCHGQQPSSASGASTDTPAQDKLTRPCPSCSAPIPLPASPCPECATLLPLRPDLSLHSLLDLSAPVANSDTGSGSAARVGLDIPAELATVPALGFDLQPRSLRNTMLFRQRDLHPDKYGSSGAEAVELAKELSGRVNGAYAVLADPLRRAEYILNVHGYPTEESDSLTDPDLLMEVLEAREELEEAESAEQVDALREANHEKVEATISALKDALSTSPPDLSLAKSLTIQLRYWTGLEAAAKEWAPGKGAGLSAGSGFTHS